MNEKEHVLNAVLLAVGLGYVVEPAGDVATFEVIAAILVPVVLGALLPDVDAHYGRHRKALHNLPVLGVAFAYPLLLGNLEWVWVGVLTHFLLDVLGSKRGIALFYPLWKREFGLPVGVPTSSRWAPVVTVLVTAVEVAVAWAFLSFAFPALPLEGAAQALGA